MMILNDDDDDANLESRRGVGVRGWVGVREAVRARRWMGISTLDARRSTLESRRSNLESRISNLGTGRSWIRFASLRFVRFVRSFVSR